MRNYVNVTSKNNEQKVFKIVFDGIFNVNDENIWIRVHMSEARIRIRTNLSRIRNTFRKSSKSLLNEDPKHFVLSYAKVLINKQVKKVPYGTKSARSSDPKRSKKKYFLTQTLIINRIIVHYIKHICHNFLTNP